MTRLKNKVLRKNINDKNGKYDMSILIFQKVHCGRKNKCSRKEIQKEIQPYSNASLISSPNKSYSRFSTITNDE